MGRIVCLLLLLLVAPSTGDKPWLRDAWKSIKTTVNDALKDVGDFFTDSFKEVSDLFATTKDDLQEKVDETAKFLEAFHDNKDELLKETRDKAHDAMENVDGWWEDTKQFSEKVAGQAEEDIDVLTSEWQTKAQKMYDDGLDELIAIAQHAKSASTTQMAFTAILISVFVTYLLR